VRDVDRVETRVEGIAQILDEMIARCTGSIAALKASDYPLPGNTRVSWDLQRPRRKTPVHWPELPAPVSGGIIAHAPGQSSFLTREYADDLTAAIAETIRSTQANLDPIAVRATTEVSLIDEDGRLR